MPHGGWPGSGVAIPIEAPQGDSAMPGRPSDVDAAVEQMEAMIRSGFIRKVYAILTVQLVITFGVLGCFQVEEWGIGEYFKENRGAYWLVFGVSIICIVALSCCNNVARKYPTNYMVRRIPLSRDTVRGPRIEVRKYRGRAEVILSHVSAFCSVRVTLIRGLLFQVLMLFTLCEGVMLGFFGLFFSTESIFYAVIMTAGVVMGLTLYACTTKKDYTGAGPFLVACLLCLIMFALVFVFIGGETPVEILRNTCSD